MQDAQDIILVVDYHARNIEFRWFNRRTGEKRTSKFTTDRSNILRRVEQAIGELPPGGNESLRLWNLWTGVPRT